MTDDIRIGSLDGLTVGEAACPDDAVILDATSADGHERMNRSLAEYTREHYEDVMTEYQHSSTHLSEQREP